MKFVLVNGRTPYQQTLCMLRCESIKSGYLRATTTQYPYCDYECYSHYCESLARLREDLAGEESRSIMSCRHLGCDWRRRSVTLAPKA